ncbi:CsrA [Desulforapulum autotrophicum HRM2]|uniref:Translational regulator CsrA n=1 Tax=Desulforapulum autotrophicum (strain ATCC 43914 / DSM 3382 / VKM B-1955 / HRM2) TaxID=177437 RepID=CSRA_DESAH|nr:carbon storage regulator CsrA [Desulforapulum autotrophicum]C0QA34.1 RecName: Full=Translational regulator CsrA [Desulforapulum autotrophicum HRM2]ACN16752.1 CsrA [Desulforapulum autotrophicum HRM2]
MLVLTRKVGESIRISDDIVVKVIDIGKNRIRIGIDAPSTVSVLRNEVYEEIHQENILSSRGSVTDLAKAATLWARKSKKEE